MFDQSLVMICPASALDVVNAAGVALGHSDNEFSVPLSPAGVAPATHYGLHTWATATTVDAWVSAPAVPPLTSGETAAMRAALVISARKDLTASEHFEAVVSDAGLVRVQEIFE